MSKSDEFEVEKPCTLYKRIITYKGHREEESWRCFLDPSDGDGFVDVPENLGLPGVVSGETTLFAPGLTVLVDDQAVLEDPTGVVLGDGRRRHRNLAVQGTLKMTVVRVTCGGNRVSKSLQAIKDDVFGDSVCLKSQMEACSNGKVKFTKGPNGGGIDLTINDCSSIKRAETKATEALASVLGTLPENTNAYFMYCMPPGLGWNGIAYAYINSWLSVYNNEWCSSVSTQVHEVGHNFNLAHSSEGNEEYGDQTGFMGYSYFDDNQSMCYNAPNMFQLGWLTQEVAELSSRPPGSYLLVGHTNFGGGLQVI